jgi:hypothetical protein
MTTEVACRGVCVGCRSQKVRTEKLGIGYPLDIGRDGARLAAQPKGLLVGLNPELGHFAHLFSTGAEHGEEEIRRFRVGGLLARMYCAWDENLLQPTGRHDDQ